MLSHQSQFCGLHPCFEFRSFSGMNLSSDQYTDRNILSSIPPGKNCYYKEAMTSSVHRHPATLISCDITYQFIELSWRFCIECALSRWQALHCFYFLKFCYSSLKDDFTSVNWWKKSNIYICATSGGALSTNTPRNQ